MTWSDARRPLTVRLLRAGSSLVREYGLASPMRVTNDWGSIGVDAGFDPAPGLDALNH